ncbi:MAG: flagellar biosynthesis anti-sigma factor FlgM [Sphingomonadaceae bacterium]|nr:flagellar biosynthesis anti-sigma factor FlgM [Sphingomonadaceae bacterium]
MSPIDIRKTLPVVPIRTVPDHAPEQHASRTAGTAQAAAPAVQIDPELAEAGKTAPVDHERVAEIREALRDGTYPIVPARIADALIAARLTLGGQA